MHSAAALDDPRNVESEDDAAKNDQGAPGSVGSNIAI